MKKARNFGMLSIALALLTTGCGGNGFPDPEPVTGTVKYKGNPVEGAVVTFLPDGSDGRAASGTTDAQGTFSLTTFSTNDGAIPGKYQITIAKADSKLANDTMDAENPGESYEAMMSAAGSGTMDKLMENQLPAKYSDSSTSGLTREVISGQKNEFGFDLE